MKSIITLVAIFLFASVMAQTDMPMKSTSEAPNFATDFSGRPLVAKTEYEIEGSPFIPANYTLAKITVGNKVYSNVKIKINLEKNVMLYEKDGVEMVPNIRVDKIEIDDASSNLNGAVFITGVVGGILKEENFVQVLSAGKTTLLKSITALYREVRPYNSAVTTRVYEQKPFYFILKSGKAVELQKNQESILAELADKRKEIEAYVAKEKIKIKKEEDLIKVFQYYNSL